jgi:hypothetical protein
VVRTFEQFLRVDIATGDSDPVYWAIAGAFNKWGREWATRYCVAMLTYYHTGTAVEAAELVGPAFWAYLRSVYPFAPRASERRHFRGAAGEQALANMEVFCPDPSYWFNRFPETYQGVRKSCEHHLSQFGPYFQLKVCDYMDRCLRMPITSYAGLESNLPREPAKAVEIMFPERRVPHAFQKLCEQAQDWHISAAPMFDRLVGPAEIETSLCGWKTTKYKGNWFGADILDKRLSACNISSPKGREMADMMPPLVPKDTFILELE